MNWLEPWDVVEQSKPFEDELRRELSADHPLFGKDITAIARRFGRDDVLFQSVERFKFLGIPILMPNISLNH